MRKITCKNLFLLIPIILLTYTNAYSFELDGFKSGMSTDAVQSKLKMSLFDKVHVMEEMNSIMAVDAYNLGYTFRFDKLPGRLIRVQKDLPPSIKNFIILVDELTNNYGSPLPSVTNVIKEKGLYIIDIAWIEGVEKIRKKIISGEDFKCYDKVTVSYYVLDEQSTEQLSIIYEEEELTKEDKDLIQKTKKKLSNK